MLGECVSASALSSAPRLCGARVTGRQGYSQKRVHNCNLQSLLRAKSVARREPRAVTSAARAMASTPRAAASSSSAAGGAQSLVSVDELRSSIWRALLAQGHLQTDAATLLDVRAPGAVAVQCLGRSF